MNVEFPEWADILFNPDPRYIVIHGGRGSSKSWSVARALLLRAAEAPLRILCGREFQNSIQESVHKLLSLQIDALGLNSFYEIQNTTIIGKNGSEFIFTGLRNNASKLKSYEAIDLVWLEEAQTVTKASWEILIPTIRKPGSQIICTFNPMLKDDFIYKLFITEPPPNSVVLKVNFTENPWFGEPLSTEMEHMRQTDPDGYLNVWLGHCRQTLDGAVYARELREAQEEGRICKVPYDPVKPVDVFFDLGWADHTAIWFAQTIGLEYRVVDYLSDNQRSINHYMKELQDKPYIYGRVFLPHDARAKQLGTGKSIEEIMRAAGWRVNIVPMLSIEDGINAVRTIFPNLWFDEDKCADGLQCIRHYRYEVDPDMGTFKRKPLHDAASHGADALRYLAVSLKPKAATGGDRYTRKYNPRKSRGSWMAA